MPLGMIFIFILFYFFCLFEGQYLQKLWVFFPIFFHLILLLIRSAKTNFRIASPQKGDATKGPQKLVFGGGPQICQGNEKS